MESVLTDITPVIRAVITLICAILSCFIVPLLRKKLTAEQLAMIQMWVKIAVDAAEQIFNGPGRGKEKKAYVISFLESKGFKIDEESIDNLIEAAVLELKRQAA